MQGVAAVVADYFGIPTALLYGHRPPRELVRARRVAVYLLRMHYGGITLRTISKHFGGHNGRAVEDLRYLTYELESDPQLRADLEQIQQQLTDQLAHQLAERPP